MKKDKKQKKIQWQQYIVVASFMLIGAVCGVLMVKHLDTVAAMDSTFGEQLFSYALLLVVMYVALFLQVVIHEAGHLVFGLLTGYRYSSFRIGSLMWIKEGGKLRFKRLSIAGTGGQCLMSPPEMSGGKIPFALYNLGGSLLNAVSGLVFFGLYLLFGHVPYLSLLLLMLSVIGFTYALMNGIPMRLGTVDNDGYNVLSLGKNDEALRSFWVQMKVSEQLSRGIRLKDMPEEWFAVPLPEGMKNSMTAVMGVFACNRMMDAHLFEEADRLMKKLLEMDSAIIGLHRSLMVCDQIYCELIGQNRPAVLDGLLDKQLKKFMRSMKSFPTILRVEYSYAMLAEKHAEKAAKIKAKFEQCARTHPYASDIQSERELIEIVDSVAEGKAISIQTESA